MASSPITLWQIDGETMETVTGFIFLGFKITADGDCSHEIGRCLLLRRKAKTNLDSILKSRDITLPTKVRLVKAMVFSSSHVWMRVGLWRKLLLSLLSRFSSVWLFATPWTVAYQPSPSMGFSRQEYWSGLPFPSPGGLPDPGIEPGSTRIEGRRFNLWATRATREAPQK